MKETRMGAHNTVLSSTQVEFLYNCFLEKRGNPIFRILKNEHEEDTYVDF
jgi:hypothetical protein